MGTEGADRLAERGKLSHPYNETRRAERVAPDDQVLTRQDTDLPSHYSWVLSEYEGSLVEGGDENSYNSSPSVHSVSPRHTAVPRPWASDRCKPGHQGSPPQASPRGVGGCGGRHSKQGTSTRMPSPSRGTRPFRSGLHQIGSCDAARG